jgi:DNA-binding transcriptional LysR family regulator
VALVPTAYAQCLAQPDLLIKPLRQPVVSRDVYLVSKRGRSLSLACQSFVQVLREELAAGRAMPQVGKVAVPKATRTT